MEADTLVQSVRAMASRGVLLQARQYIARYRMRRRRKQLDDEQPLAAYLNWLRAKGYRIIDGIPGDSMDFDHVVVCTQGVYLLNVKTRRRPTDGDCIAEFNGAGIAINGGPFDVAPVNDVKAQAEQLERILKECTERSYAVRPVLLFPGWHIKDSEAPKTSGVWVLNPRSLGKWIDFRPPGLHPDLVELAAQGLDKYVRQFD
jgi:Nuclease-related domain